MDQSANATSSTTPTNSPVGNVTSVGGGISSDSAYNSEYENSAEGHNSFPKYVEVKITDEKLFKRFYKVGNENIVTKSGRRLFPALMVTVQGLEPETLYNVAFRVTSADPYCYRFIQKKWTAVGKSAVDQNVNRQISLHPYSPKNGESWMKRPISFKSVKFTHNPKSKTDLILIHTMHKYVLEIIFTVNPGSDTAQDIVVPLKYTSFMAVVAYQNVAIIDLKVTYNPYANCSNEKFQREIEDLANKFPIPCYNPYLAQMLKPNGCTMTPPLALTPNLSMYNPLSAFGVAPPLPLPGTSTMLTSSSSATNLPMYSPLSAFGVPAPPLPLTGTSTVPTLSSTAPNLPIYKPMPGFGVPVLPPNISGTSTVVTSSSTAENLPIYKPMPSFGGPVPPHTLTETSTPITSPSTAPNLLTYKPISAFGVSVPPFPLSGANTMATSLSTVASLPMDSSLPTFGVPVPKLALSGENTVLTSSSTGRNFQMYNPLNLPTSPLPPFYPISSLFPPFYLNSSSSGSITTQKTESNTVPPTTQK